MFKYLDTRHVALYLYSHPGPVNVRERLRLGPQPWWSLKF